MRHEIDIPDDLEQWLSVRSSETGQDVPQLIRVAVRRFVEEEDSPAAGGDWSEEVQTRRRVLIDRDIAGTISLDEQAELTRLDRLANEYFDRVGSPSLEGARRLHDRLVKRRANGQ